MPEPKPDRPKCSACPNPIPVGTSRRKYCSDRCMHAAAIQGIKDRRNRERVPFVPKACKAEGCSVVFTTNLPGKRYCGPVCAAVARTKSPGGNGDGR